MPKELVAQENIPDEFHNMRSPPCRWDLADAPDGSVCAAQDAAPTNCQRDDSNGQTVTRGSRGKNHERSRSLPQAASNRLRPPSSVGRRERQDIETQGDNKQRDRKVDPHDMLCVRFAKHHIPRWTIELLCRKANFLIFHSF
jgi:hypothetical protein